MATVAVLDDAGRLIKYKSKKAPSDTDVVVPDECDLPTDGTYYWNAEQGAFFPVGRGAGKPKAAPVSDHHALYMTAKMMEKKAPQELKDWLRWYEDTFMKGAK